MNLRDLHNPNGITEIHHRKTNSIIGIGRDQGFQEYPGSVELWQMFEGQLMRVRRWLKKSLVSWDCTDPYHQHDIDR